MATTVSLAEVRRIIREARDLIADGTKWTQGFEAINEYGESVPTNSPEATHFCAIGAVCHVMGMENADYQNAVYKRVQDMLDAAAQQIGDNLAMSDLEDDLGLEAAKAGCQCSEDNGFFCDYCDARDHISTFSNIVDLNDESPEAHTNVLMAFDRALREIKRAKAAARA